MAKVDLCERCRSRARWALLNPRGEHVMFLCVVCRPLVDATIEMVRAQEHRELGSPSGAWIWVPQ